MMRLALILVCALGVSCGRETARVQRAELALRQGNLEGAQAALADSATPAANEVRGRIEAVRGLRAETARFVNEILARAPAAPREELLELLRKRRVASGDPVALDDVERAMSKLNDIYASRPRRTSAKRAAVAMLPEQSGSPDEPELAEVLTRDPPVESHVVVQAASAAEGADVVSAGDDYEDDLEDDRQLELRADVADRKGRLAAAAELLHKAAAAAYTPLRRAALSGRATDLEEELILRSVLLESGNPDLAHIPDVEDYAWDDLDERTLRKLCRRLALPPAAEHALARARFLAGDERPAEASLHQWLEEGRMTRAEVFGRLARWREEELPPNGYAWDGRSWVLAGRQLNREQTRLRKKLTERLQRARGSELDVAWDEALEVLDGDDVDGLLRRLMGDVGGVLERAGALKHLAGLGGARRGLDVLRAEALALIRDEETYFYPFRPPACPAEKARLYPAAQRTVDLAVKEVRAALKGGRTVRLGRRSRAQLQQAAWLAARAAELGLDIPSTIPSWIRGLPPEADEITLSNFAWSAAERVELELSQLARVRNRALWESGETGPTGRAAGREEQRQVQLTNDYRVLLGLRALVWNSRLQVAAFEHSEWVQNSGEFSHTEPRPGRGTAEERLARVSYYFAGPENMHTSSSAAGAHAAWLQSSEHHRNLLRPELTEMASAQVGSIWTQNFGWDASVREELKSWFD